MKKRHMYVLTEYQFDYREATKGKERGKVVPEENSIDSRIE